MPSASDVVKQHIEAFNAQNASAEPWAEDAELIAPRGTHSGREAVVAFNTAFQQAFPDGKLEIKKILRDGGPNVSVEGEFTGTHTGPLASPDGEVPPTGNAVTFRWAAAYVVRGEELASEHLYFDQVELLGQLGLLPVHA